jgi:threonine dehydratase
MNQHAIEAAAARFAADGRGFVRRTPLWKLPGSAFGVACAEIWLKLEHLQVAGSFKARGMYNRLLANSLPASGVIVASGGNAGIATAAAARALGARCEVFVPTVSSPAKQARLRELGAEVVVSGSVYAEALEACLARQRETGALLTHAYDQPEVVAGAGTLALELQEQGGEPPDSVLVSVGGGGLIAGIATAAKAMKPGIQVVGVQTLRFPNMFNAVKHAALPQGGSTIAEGIAVGTPGQLTRQLIEQHVDDLVLVDEGDIEQAIVMLLEIEKTLVEGAGAAPLAALLKEPQRLAGRKVGLVLGGGNIDPMLLAAIIHRGMVRAGRLARLRVSARDVPGSLARITAIISEAGANIDEVHHQRAFTMLAAQNVEIELVIQTRGREHIQGVLAALHAGGFQAEEQR